MKKYLLIALCLMGTWVMAQKPAYLLYSGQGKGTNYKKMMKALKEADVVFFGEYHNNTIAHWLELEVLRDLAEVHDDWVAGCEMFEADDQMWVDQYLAGTLTADSMMKKARIWPNYKTDYHPILAFCKEKGIPMIATNVPRPYARMVSRGGFEALDTLPDNEKAWFCPMPISPDYELPSYAEMIKMMSGHAGGMDPKNFVNAQALKDATMAHFLIKNMPEGSHFYHFNGSYHSDNKEGIIWWLKKQKPGLKVVNITTREYPEIEKFQAEDKGVADFILYVPERMTHTY